MRPAASVWSASTTRPAPAVRHALLAAALSLGIAVGLVAAADEPAQAQDGPGPWPQWTGDAGHTRKADAAGPDDPGLAWWRDVEALTPPDDSTHPSDEPYESLQRWPSLSPTGDVLVRAVHPDDDGTSGEGRLLALDRDTGDLLWELADVREVCGQAADSQGRVWVQRTDEDPPWPIEAVDAASGEPITGTRIDDTLGCSGEPNHLQIGGDPEHLVVVGGSTGRGAHDGVGAYDISGDTPGEAWRLTEADDAIEGMLAGGGSGDRHQQVLVADDAVYAPVEVADPDDPDGPTRPELVEIDLGTGEIADSVRIPIDVAQADHDEPRADDVKITNFVRAGDVLVLGVEAARLSDARGLLAGIDLATGLDEIAWQTPTGVDDEFTDGPRGLTLGDGVVALRDAAAGAEPLRAYAPADGSRQWTGEPERAYPATGVGARLADADGNLYVHAPGEAVDLDRGALARLDATGGGQWYVPDAALEQQMALEADELWRDLAVANLDDGLLVVTEDPEASAHDAGRVIAVDDSGGLAQPWPDPDADPEPDDPQQPDERIGGSHRIATSVELSQQFDSADTVVLATAEDYPDSLAGAPLASQLGAPILLTVPDGVSASVVDEIQRLGATRAVLLGGEAALGPGVEDGLRAQGIEDIERFAGSTRFHTAALIASEVQQQAENSSSAYVVEGAHADPARGWPDAVGVSALAAHQEQPILLVTRDQIPRTTMQAAEVCCTHFTIVGGTGAVSEDVADGFRALDEAAGEAADVTVERVAGADRYDTSAQLADRSVTAGMDPSAVYLATGGNWPDSLSAAPVAGATAADLGVRRGVLLLADGRDLSFSSASADWLENHAGDIDSVTAVGGTAAISDDVLTEAQSLVE